jgi:hypothetical protein
VPHAIAVFDKKNPNEIVAARLEVHSIGVGEGEFL